MAPQSITDKTKFGWYVFVAGMSLAFWAGGVVKGHGQDISALQTSQAKYEARLNMAEVEHQELRDELHNHLARSDERWRSVAESLTEIKIALGLKPVKPVARGEVP